MLLSTSLIVFPLACGNEESPEFLETDYEPLAIWFDERFEVKFRAMSPALIFDQLPLSEIFYQTSNLPLGEPSFNFESKDISRRELLQAIAGYWGLSMSFSFDDDGAPNAVVVEGTAVDALKKRSEG